jgi:hypothetical protein
MSLKNPANRVVTASSERRDVEITFNDVELHLINRREQVCLPCNSRKIYLLLSFRLVSGSLL